MIYVHVADVDAAIEKAVNGGAKILLPAQDHFCAIEREELWMRKVTYGQLRAA